MLDKCPISIFRVGRSGGEPAPGVWVGGGGVGLGGASDGVADS